MQVPFYSNIRSYQDNVSVCVYTIGNALGACATDFIVCATTSLAMADAWWRVHGELGD